MHSRRDFNMMVAAGIAAGAFAPGLAKAQTPGNVPRNRTLIAPWNVNGPVFRNVGLGNPFSINEQDIRGSILQSFEALFYFNIQENKLVPWLGETFEYMDDYTAVRIKLRPGVEWSDGQPFSARDVAFTYNMLRDVGLSTRDLRYSTDVAESVTEAKIIDDLTVDLIFTGRNPRFAEALLMSYVDKGFPMMPEHIWKDVDDYASFLFFDLEKGWPVTTGPWRVTRFTDTQCFLDRRDDWWAAKTGFHPLPEVERFIGVPSGGADQVAQLLVTNQIDLAIISATDIIEGAKARNSSLVTYTNETPYGELNSWAPSLYFNHKKELWQDVRLRKAINYFIDRDQIVENFAPGSKTSFGPFAQLETMAAVNDRIKPLAEKYGVGAHDPVKGEALMKAIGYRKNSDGLWEKDGVVLSAIIEGIAALNRVGPLVSQQLRNNGLDVTFRSTPESRAVMRDGNYDLTVFGHQTSDLDPFETLEIYHSKNAREIGKPTLAVSRWSNAKYDALVEEAAKYQSTDPKFVDLAVQAMEIWMSDVVEAPILNWYTRTIANTTYWTNWPDENNPYAPAANHRLSGYFGYVLNRLKATS